MNKSARGRRNISVSRQTSVSDKNASLSPTRKTVKTQIKSQYTNNDLEKMRSDLNTISSRLNDVEKKLPVLHPKSPSSSRTSRQPDSARRNVSARSNRIAYSATEFNDETQPKTKQPHQSSGYLSKMSSVGDSYDSSVMARISTDRAEQKRKNLVINIQKELKEWKDSHSKTISIQTDALPEPSKQTDVTDDQIPCRESMAELPVPQVDDSPELPFHLNDLPIKLDFNIISALIELFPINAPISVLVI